MTVAFQNLILFSNLQEAKDAGYVPVSDASASWVWVRRTSLENGILRFDLALVRQ